MAFGDRGNQLVDVNGVPFRVAADSLQEAEQQVIDMLTQAPELFDQRAERLGLDTADVDALELRFSRGEGALAGEARDIETSGLDRFRIGVGHQMLRRVRGGRQLIAKLFGDETAVEVIAQEQADEDQLYRRLDEKGIGLEDVGQLSADMTAFLIPGSQGLVGGALIGAALGAADVREDVTGGSVLTDAGFGAAFGAAVPAVGRLASATRGLGNQLSVSVPVRAGRDRVMGWLRARGLRSNPGATERVVQEGLEMARQGASEGQEILGRAALDKVQSIINSLPRNADMGLRDEAAMGIVRTALVEATEQSGARNVFNPVIWERSMSELQGMIGTVFRDTAHTQALGSINILAREMQALGTEIPVELAEQAAAALIRAPARAKPVMEALRLATSEPVKVSMMEQLAVIAAEAVIETGTRAPGALPRATIQQIDDEILNQLETF